MPFDLSCCGVFFFCRGEIVFSRRCIVSIADCKGPSYFVSSYYPVEKGRITVSTTDEISVLSNTRHVEVISQNFIASSMADPYCCCEIVYRLGAVSWHKLCNFLDLAFSSNCLRATSTHTTFQTINFQKTSVTAKQNTATQCVLAVNLLNHFKRFGSGIA